MMADFTVTRPKRGPDPVGLMMDGRYAEALAQYEQLLQCADDFIGAMLSGQAEFCRRMMTKQQKRERSEAKARRALRRP